MPVLAAPTVDSFTSGTDTATYDIGMSFAPVLNYSAYFFVLSGLSGAADECSYIDVRGDLGTVFQFQPIASIKSGNGNLCLTLLGGTYPPRPNFSARAVFPKAQSSVSVVSLMYGDINGAAVKKIQHKMLFQNTVNGPTFDTPPKPDNSVFAAAGWSVATAITPGTGYTQMGVRGNQTTPVAQLECQRKHGGAAAFVPFTFPSTGGVRLFAALELEDPTVAGPVVKYWDGTSEVAATLSYWDGTNEVPLTIDQITP